MLPRLQKTLRPVPQGAGSAAQRGGYMEHSLMTETELTLPDASRGPAARAGELPEVRHDAGAVVAATPRTEWTCPMHPQIVRDAPGSCPICGMALEPRTAGAVEGPDPELVDMTRRFWIGSCSRCRCSPSSWATCCPASHSVI